MGLLNDKNRNALIDLSDRIDPDSINVSIYDNTIFIPFIKEISSQTKKLPLAVQQSHILAEIMRQIKANNCSWLFSLGGLSKFAVETLRLKGTKRGKVYNISSRIHLHTWINKKQLYINFGQMACVVSVKLKQDIPCINGFVKVYKDGTFEYGQ